ncbi:glycosyltransferase family 4 protein [Candidatus Falkowbacteria bacterium]|nr:glycosyltransferase family 4 protein [Candidatus Falkowbacteria bacterium]
MNILFTTEYFPPFTLGGAEWSAYWHAKGLSEKGHNVFVLTPNYAADKYEEEKDGRLTICRFPLVKLTSKRNNFINYFWLNPFWMYATSTRIYRLAKNHDIEVIHAQGKFSIPPMVLANLFLKRKTVATFRDYMALCNFGFCIQEGKHKCSITDYFLEDYKYYWENYVEQKGLLKRLRSLAAALVGRLNSSGLFFFVKRINGAAFVSKYVMDTYSANGLGVQVKKKVIYNSSPIESKLQLDDNEKTAVKQLVSYVDNEKIILFGSKISLGKGAVQFLEAADKLTGKNQGYKFVLAGDIHLSPAVIERFKKNEKILFLGKIPHQQLNYLYTLAFAAVIPSLYQEPLSRITIESMFHHVPVISSNRGGQPEIVIDKETGLLVDPTKPEEIAAAIELLASDQELYKKIQINAPAKIEEKFSLPVAISEIEKFYGTL